MPLAIGCVLFAALLPYAFTGLAKFAGGPRYDNHAPREFLERLHGWRKRAHWAQLNAFEAFPPFAAGVLLAQQAGAAQATVDGLALAFVAARIAHGAFYLMDQAALRSLAWSAGLGAMIGLFVVAARA